MKKILKNNLLPLQLEGLPYVLGGILLFLASAMIFSKEQHGESLLKICVWVFFTVLFSLFTLFSIWFYRNPPRHTPLDDPKAVFSPADGTVLKIENTQGTKIGEGQAKKISIFMSPVDVHINRTPVSGVVESIYYHQGKFYRADIDKASQENEHNVLVMKTDAGLKIAFVQIAGFIARRIVCYVEAGDHLKAGERYGMIRFGSRMEVIMPSSSQVLVSVGEKVKAGLTKLARTA